MEDLPRIKVLFAGPLPPPVHGISVIQETIVNSDLRDRFEVGVLDTADRSRSATKTIGRFSPGNALRAVSQCVRLLIKLITFRPRCVFLYLSQGKWGFLRDSVFIRLSDLFSAAVIANLGGSRFREFYESRPPRRRKRMRRVLEKISVIEVLSESLRDIFTGLVPADRISVVPNGIKLEEYSRIGEERAARPPGQNVLSLGSLSIAKGILELLDAFDLLAARLEGTRFTLAGPWKNDEDRRLILARIDSSPFRDRIELTGEVRGRSKLEVLARADLFVQLSHSEGQSIALIEAVAAGLPALCTRQGANSDVVVDRKGGYILDSFTPEPAAVRMAEILTDGEAYRRFSRFNLGHTRGKFDQSVLIGNVERDILRAARLKKRR